MPINDFLKFNSAASPNESFAKMPINDRFRTKIKIKNGTESSTKNSGMVMETKDVATSHIKMIFRRLLGLNA